MAGQKKKKISPKKSEILFPNNLNINLHGNQNYFLGGAEYEIIACCLQCPSSIYSLNYFYCI